MHKTYDADESMAIVVVHFTSMTVDMFNQYLLFDSLAIVAAVGGSLGLFIGFSFYDCAAYFINHFT